jgi:hypothetical protein
MISHVVKMNQKAAVAASVGAHLVPLRRRGRFAGSGTAAAVLGSSYSHPLAKHVGTCQ